MRRGGGAGLAQAAMENPILAVIVFLLVIWLAWWLLTR